MSNLIGSSSYVSRDEIFTYIKYVAYQVLQLKPSEVALDTKVNRAVFSRTKGIWRIEATNVTTGSSIIEEHAYLVAATGQLSTPAYPENIAKTMGQFTGLQFHSSEWPANLNLQGKRVASIGTGCSAAQYLPEIAPFCKELLVFQRSPGFVIPKQSYRYPRFVQWVFRKVPPVTRLYRLFLMAFQDMLFHLGVKMVPGKQALTNRLLSSMFLHDMRKMAPKELWENLIPDFPVMAKRVIVSSDYLPMFRRENVKLVPKEVKAIVANGIICVDGTKYDNIDVIIFGTGFRTHQFLCGVTVEVEETGQNLHKNIWTKLPFAYKGLTVPGLPNMGIIFGPNTATGHSSAVTFEEAGVEHLFELVSTCVLQGKKTFEVDEEVCKQYNQAIQRRLKDTVWSWPVHNWYRADDGTVVNNYPGSTWEFCALAKPTSNEYRFT
jgi:cation diffusion facilitator CzcD-associated flavoprotein CzcO